MLVHRWFGSDRHRSNGWGVVTPRVWCEQNLEVVTRATVLRLLVSTDEVGEKVPRVTGVYFLKDGVPFQGARVLPHLTIHTA
jgi:hypothetical protein